MNERVELLISGVVQGVFYRASCQQEAERLGLTGEVANLPDGRVRAVAEGPRKALDEFVAWCRKGPPHAQVADVETRWSVARGDLQDFCVTR